MRRVTGLASVFVPLVFAAAAAGQPTPPAPAGQPFTPGEPLKLMPNSKVYGSFRFSESLAYDEARDLYVSVNAGMPQDVVPNDGYVSLVNPTAARTR